MTDDKPQTFADISNERQWGWGEELEVLWELIEAKGLTAEADLYARWAADREIAEEERERAADAAARAELEAARVAYNNRGRGA